MPIFKATLSDGRVATLESDHEPTEQEVLDAIEQQADPETSAIGSTIRSAVNAALPAAGAAVGARVGYGLGALAGIESGPGMLLTSAAGGLLGALGTEKLIDKASHAIAPKAMEEWDRLVEAGYRQHPIPSFIGSVAGSLPTFEFSPGATVQGLAQIPKVFAKTATQAQQAAAASAATQVGMGAGLGVVSPMIDSAIEGRNLTEGITARGVAESALSAALLGSPRSKALRIGERPAIRTPNPPAIRAATEVEFLNRSKPTGQKWTFTDKPLERPEETFNTLKDGSVLINRKNFHEQLESDLVEGKNLDKAMDAMISEEQIHGRVRTMEGGDEMAANFYRQMTAMEKWIVRRRYDGPPDPKNPRPLRSDSQYGHEAIRFQMQRAMKMTPGEYLFYTHEEIINSKMLTMLEDVVRWLRESFGTKASKANLEILDKVELNIRTALAAREKGATDASSQQKTTTIHGDVQPQPVEGQGKVSAQEGGAGVLPQAEGRVAEAPPLSLKPQKDRTAALLKNPPVVKDVPVGSIPPGGLIPAIRLINGDAVHGWVKKTGKVSKHPEIAKRYGITVAEMDRKGFVDRAGKNFYEREPAAIGTQLPTGKKKGELHSTDLPPQEAPPAAPTEGAQPRQAPAGKATATGAPAPVEPAATSQPNATLPPVQLAPQAAARLAELQEAWKTRLPTRAEMEEHRQLTRPMVEASVARAKALRESKPPPAIGDTLAMARKGPPRIDETPIPDEDVPARIRAIVDMGGDIYSAQYQEAMIKEMADVLLNRPPEDRPYLLNEFQIQVQRKANREATKVTQVAEGKVRQIKKDLTEKFKEEHPEANILNIPDKVDIGQLTRDELNARIMTMLNLHPEPDFYRLWRVLHKHDPSIPVDYVRDAWRDNVLDFLVNAPKERIEQLLEIAGKDLETGKFRGVIADFDPEDIMSGFAIKYAKPGTKEYETFKEANKYDDATAQAKIKQSLEAAVAKLDRFIQSRRIQPSQELLDKVAKYHEEHRPVPAGEPWMPLPSDDARAIRALKLENEWKRSQRDNALRYLRSLYEQSNAEKKDARDKLDAIMSPAVSERQGKLQFQTAKRDIEPGGHIRQEQTRKGEELAKDRRHRAIAFLAEYFIGPAKQPGRDPLRPKLDKDDIASSFTLDPQMAKNLQFLRMELWRGTQVPNVSVSKLTRGVVILVNEATKQHDAVSLYLKPGTKEIYINDPTWLPGDRTHDHIPLTSVIASWHIKAMYLLESPVHKFHQRWKNEADFNRDIGDYARLQEVGTDLIMEQYNRHLNEPKKEKRTALEKALEDKPVTEEEASGEKTVAETPQEEAKAKEEGETEKEAEDPNSKAILEKQLEEEGLEGKDLAYAAGMETGVEESHSIAGPGESVLGLLKTNPKRIARGPLTATEAGAIARLLRAREDLNAREIPETYPVLSKPGEPRSAYEHPKAGQKIVLGTKLNSPFDLIEILEGIQRRRNHFIWDVPYIREAEEALRKSISKKKEKGKFGIWVKPEKTEVRTRIGKRRGLQADDYAFASGMNKMARFWLAQELKAHRDSLRKFPRIPKDVPYDKMSKAEQGHVNYLKSLEQEALLKTLYHVYELYQNTKNIQGPYKGDVPLNETAFGAQALDVYGDTARRSVEWAEISRKHAERTAGQSITGERNLLFTGSRFGGRPRVRGKALAHYPEKLARPVETGLISGGPAWYPSPKQLAERNPAYISKPREWGGPVGLHVVSPGIPSPAGAPIIVKGRGPMSRESAAYYEWLKNRQALSPAPAMARKGGVGIANRVEEAMRARGVLSPQEETTGKAPTRLEILDYGRMNWKGWHDVLHKMDLAESEGMRGVNLYQEISTARYGAFLLDKRVNELAQQPGGMDSPAFKEAKQQADDFHKRIKNSYKVEASSALRAFQGEQDPETGLASFVRSFEESKGRKATKKELLKISEIVEGVKHAEDEVDIFEDAYTEEVKSAASPEQKKLAAHMGQTIVDVNERVDRISQAADDFLDQLNDPGRSAMAAKGKKAPLPELSDAELSALGNKGLKLLNKLSEKNELTDARFEKEMGDMLRSKYGGKYDPYLGKIRMAAEKIREEFLDNLIGTGSETTPLKDFLKRKRPTEEESRAVIARALQIDPEGKHIRPIEAYHMWNYIRYKYLDRGLKFNEEVRFQAAKELGISVSRLYESLAANRTLQKASNEMLQKSRDYSRVTGEAKNWVKNARYPGWLKWVRRVPRYFFMAKIAGHGMVPLITHAGNMMFNPYAWKVYFPAWLEMYKMSVPKFASRYMGARFQGKGPKLPGREYADRMMEELRGTTVESRARFEAWRKANLEIDPFSYTDDYQIQWLRDKFGGRGFDALKTLRLEFAEYWWSQVPEYMRIGDAGEQMRILIADSVNHATGIVKTNFHEVANWALFAPKLEASRWAFLFKDTVKALNYLGHYKTSSAEQLMWAKSEIKQKASMLAMYYVALGINQAMLWMTPDNKDKINITDPSKPDFMWFKIPGHRVGVVNPLVGIMKLFAKLLHDANGELSPMERMKGRRELIGKTLWDYGTGKMSPFAGFVYSTASSQDYDKRPMPWSKDRITRSQLMRGVRPYGWGEWAVKEAAPIPLEEALQAWKDMGMKSDQAERLMATLLVGVTAAGTGVRIAPETK